MKTKMLLAALVLLSSTAYAEDKVDILLKNRATMVAAVALLTRLPPNCTVDNKTPDPDQVARFAYVHGYGHSDADMNAFMAEVKAHVEQLDEALPSTFTEKDRKDYAEGMCAYGILLTGKVRQANPQAQQPVPVTPQAQQPPLVPPVPVPQVQVTPETEAFRKSILERNAREKAQ